MKKLFLFFTLILFSIFQVSAYDTHSTFAASLGFGSESGKSNGISASSSLGNFGIFMGTGFFPDFKNVGFHFDMDFHLANWASNSEGSVGTSSIGGDKSFAIAYQLALGPSFKKETDDILVQFTPELGIALEMETGKVSYYSYSYSYSYTGFLFGFGGDLSLALKPTNKCSFAMGTHLAYYPVYSPSIKINDKAYDINFDSYSRFMMNIYLGVQIHNHR